MRKRIHLGHSQVTKPAGTAADGIQNAEQNPVQMNPRITLAIPKPKDHRQEEAPPTRLRSAETRETCPKAINETGAVPTVAARETAAHEAIDLGRRCSIAFERAALVPALRRQRRRRAESRR
jgi:hypothetical protein